MDKQKFGFILALGLTAIGLAGTVTLRSEEAASPAHSMKMASSEKIFTVVGVEYQGTKIWIPGTLIVKLGDKVKIKLINNIKSEPNTHGFAIDEYNIKKVVARGKPDNVEFTADKEGVFTIYCQIHPAHVGGQLLVIK